MKGRISAKAARSGLCVIFSVYLAVGHCEENGFAKWADAHAHPITTIDSQANDSDLLPLESAIGTSHVVAFGEPTHGAHEPLAFRNRLFRFLVERMGFTAIALESGFTESISARSFIEGGEGDAETAAQNGFASGLQRYLENRELIQWMRDYNATVSSAGQHKIHLYGIDLPFGARVGGARRSINSALSFLSLANPVAAQRIRNSLGDGLPGSDAGEFGSLSSVAQSEFERSIEAIAKALQKSRKNLIAQSSEEEYRWAVHNLDVARQFAKCLPLTPPPGARDRSAWNAWVVTFECRDSAMAKNVQWALGQEGRQGRLLVFAHDGHVMSWKEDGPRWAEARNRPPMMGLFLRRVYGEDLYIIAMSSATASGGLPSKPMQDDSIDRTLTDAGLPLMFLDVRQGRQNEEARSWLSTPRSFLANVSADCLVRPSTALDAFFFVSNLTPAILSSSEAP
jgi:erythromycin esterase